MSNVLRYSPGIEESQTSARQDVYSARVQAESSAHALDASRPGESVLRCRRPVESLLESEPSVVDLPRTKWTGQGTATAGAFAGPIEDLTFDESSDRRKRQRAAAALLRKWLSEADADDEATWQHLERELPNLRLRLSTREGKE
jgi:hypothetical protein